jgi:hypothetical protein
LASSYSASSLTSATAFTTRSRYLISNAATVSATANYLSIGSTYDATTGYTAGAGTLTSSSTYKDYLSKIVLAVSDSSGYFRLDSHLHPNDSIDADSTDTVAYKLKFRNNFGKAAKTYGYVLFAYDSTNKVLQAKKRYTCSHLHAGFQLWRSQLLCAIQQHDGCLPARVGAHQRDQTLSLQFAIDTGCTE